MSPASSLTRASHAAAVGVAATGMLSGLRRATDRGWCGGTRRWDRINHRGETVSLLEGPALALAATAGVLTVPGLSARGRTAAVIALLGPAVVGGLDDLSPVTRSPTSPDDKGFSGHLRALRHGRVTTGVVKIAGIGVSGLMAAMLAGPDRGSRWRAVDTAVAGAVVAGSANLINLLDLRPGRALKVTALAGLAGALAGSPPAAVAGGAAVGLLPTDLAERTMLGDTGANPAGALLGVALVAGSGPRVHRVALAALVGLTLASERISFTRVIEGTPILRELDGWGRRPR